MRNLLKRRPAGETKPTLRERFAATKAKYGRTLAAHRVLNAPPPAPAVDRAALVNYSTWLSFERERVCAELYPHMGTKASRFVLTMNAAERFFYPDGIGNLLSRTWRDVPPASARAVKVLDLVGVDWRQDTDEHSRRHFDAADRADTGKRPAVPHGWPRIDAALLDALDDLNRLDAAQDAMGTAGRGGERDADTVPGYEGLEDARSDALDRLGKLRAESLIGLQAKAKALLTRSVSDMGGRPSEDIAESLARDLLGASSRTIEPRPDPIFAAIETCKRLAAEHAAIHDVCAGTPDGDPAWEGEPEAHKASWAQWSDVVLQTVPRTAEGCRALAAYARDWFAQQQVGEDEDGPAVLALIARSPLL